MEHAILYGEHDLVIDEKNRMLIPAEIRKALEAFNDGSTYFVLIGVDRRPWLFPERLYKALVSTRQQDLAPSADRLLAVRRDFKIASWQNTQFRRDPAQLEADVEALRAAGLPMS